MPARQSTDTCASCREFPIREVQDNPHVVCQWRPGSTYYWNSGACVLYVYDADHREARRRIVKIMREREDVAKQEGNATG